VAVVARHAGGSLEGLGAELTAAGRVTGLLGGYLLLVEVALMSRVPWLERRIGWWQAHPFSLSAAPNGRSAPGFTANSQLRPSLR
jgi:hypothetical protein